LVTVVAGLVLLGVPNAASAAPPVCQAEEVLYQLPAGSTWKTTPRAPCTDADGDPISIEISDAPDFGTFDPPGMLSIDAVRSYTANADAAGNRDRMKLRAVANGETSAQEVTWDVWILPPNHAPACADLALTVRAGASIAVPVPSCTDADSDRYYLSVLDGPAHGTYAFGMYRPASGFTGRDSMGFAVVDEWGAASVPGRITITVTPEPPRTQGDGPADRTAPRLRLAAPSSMRARKALRRGIRFTATTSEAGRLVVEAFIDRSTARGLRINRRVGTLSRRLSAGDTTVKLKLARKARNRLRTLDEVSLKLIARISDAAGNVRTERLRVTLRND
jgi:hypothetical protein